MKAHNLDAFLKLPADPTPFHCFPLLPRNGLLLVFGPTKHYKSFFMMNMCYELAEGLPVLGKWPISGDPKRVLYIEQECGQDEAQRRLGKIHGYRKGKNVQDNLWIVSRDLDCALDSQQGLDVLLKHVEMAKPQIIVLDPFSWFHSRPGNDNDEIKGLVKKFLKLTQEKNMASMFSHHSGKRSEFRNGDGTDVTSIKGATALAEAASSIIGLSKPTTSETVIRLDFTLRHAPNPKHFKIKFDGEDDGDTNTFAIVP